VIHETAGEYRLYVWGGSEDGEIITVTGKNSTKYGNIDRVFVGECGATLLEHSVYVDCVILSTANIGEEDYSPPPPPFVYLAVASPEEFKTYSTGNISVEMYAEGGTIDKIWFNCKNDTDWIFGSNQTYTGITQMTDLPQASYVFYGWANNTEGSLAQKTVSFSFYIYFFNEYESSSSALVYGQNFSLQFYEGQSLGFQTGMKTVVLDMTVGNLTSNQTTVDFDSGGGMFQFKANENFTMKITYDVAKLKVGGDKGSQDRGIKSGTSINIDANDIVTIEWNIFIAPLLPLLFILGMFGLLSMGGGSIYAVQQIKEKEYRNGFRNGAIFITIGFAFFLAWLW